MQINCETNKVKAYKEIANKARLLTAAVWQKLKDCLPNSFGVIIILKIYDIEQFLIKIYAEFFMQSAIDKLILDKIAKN